MTGVASSGQWPQWAREISMVRGAPNAGREAALPSGQTDGKRRILEALCATTGWRRGHPVPALRPHETGGPDGIKTLQERRRMKIGLAVRPATPNRLLLGLKVVESGGRRRPAGFHVGDQARSIRTFDWKSPPRPSLRRNGNCGPSDAGSRP
jgi:hypothetical protein